MYHNQRLNYNSSLLLHSLFKTEDNLSNLSFQKKSKSSLMSELNMTYSRLTETRFDQVYEPQQIQQDIEYDFERENDSQEIQLPKCQNCYRLNCKLKQVEMFLVNLQAKFIEKETLLSKKYKELCDQLLCRKEEVQNYEKLYNQIKQENNYPKQLEMIPKLQLKNCQTSSKYDPSTSKTELFKQKTLVSTKSDDHVRFLRSKKLSRVQTQIFKENIFKDPVKQHQLSKNSFRSKDSSLELVISSSQRQQSNCEQSYRQFEKKEFCGNKRVQQSKFKEKDCNQDYELCRLRFENSSLKSYNEVLLTHAKPKSLASKVFMSVKG